MKSDVKETFFLFLYKEEADGGNTEHLFL